MASPPTPTTGTGTGAGVVPPSSGPAVTAVEPRGARRRQKGVTPRRKHSFSALLKRDWQMLVLMIPGAVFLLLFFYIPIFGNVIAFQDYQPYYEITEAPFVGLDNFADIATDRTAKDRLCFNCRQPGHESRACPKPRGVLNRKCGGCGEKGHVADDCEHREVGAVGPSPNITSMGPFINRIALDMQELC